MSYIPGERAKAVSRAHAQNFTNGGVVSKCLQARECKEVKVNDRPCQPDVIGSAESVRSGVGRCHRDGTFNFCVLTLVSLPPLSTS